MIAMNLLLAILLGTGAVIGALGMLLLIAGGIAAAMIDADAVRDVTPRDAIDTTARPVGVRPTAPASARSISAVAA